MGISSFARDRRGLLNASLLVSMIAVVSCGRSDAERDTATNDQTLPLDQKRSEPRQYRIEGNQIIVDTFEVRYDLRDGQLTLALDTDLGDAAVLMVSVSRSYQKRGNNEKYPLDYFSERSSVGAWREPRRIVLDHEAWRRKLEQRERTLASAGEPITVSRILGDIDVSFVIPINQDPPLQPLNANLNGNAVTRNGDMRLVRQQVVVNHPIN